MSRKVNINQLKAIYMLCMGKTGVEVASKLGLRQETLSRWKQNTDFQNKLQEIMKEKEITLRCRLMQLYDPAIDAIATGLNNPYKLDQLEAALKVLDKLRFWNERTPIAADNAPK